MSYLRKFRIFLRLGIVNLFRVACHRLLKSAGLYRYLTPLRQPISGPFVSSCADTSHTWENVYFGFHRFGPVATPNWFLNPFSQHPFTDSSRHWSDIPDFSDAFGDIKIAWELSRFDWCVQFAVNFRKSGDKEWLVLLEKWLRSWCRANPPNQGPNWKCGQEAAIRVFHLATTLRLLGRGIDSPGLSEFFRHHLKRISATLYYAISQNNNHGTSEAAALFIGGALYAKAHPENTQGHKWRDSGRKWLEERVSRLIEPDGTFSQYSMNYHRVVLDTLTMAEYFRQAMSEPPFSGDFYTKAIAATTWLESVIDAASGDAPNFGTNDGARLFPISESDFRDFRPTLARAALVFMQRNLFPTSPAAAELAYLGLPELPPSSLSQRSVLFRDGGLAIYHFPHFMLLCRVSCFNFRPSHADALHLDLWWNGENWLRDGGSFSYHTDENVMSYFSGTASHNTIEFDNRDQMPRIGRFLFGEWLDVHIEHFEATPTTGKFLASYTDYRGATHSRAITTDGQRVTIIDTVSGNFSEAKLRWRLKPGNWTLTSTGCTLDGFSIDVTAAHPLALSIEKGYESRYYMNKSEIPVLTALLKTPSVITTEILLQHP